MAKKVETKTIMDPAALLARLAEIRETTFGVLSDDEVLQLLASRKQLEEDYHAYEEAKEAEEKRVALKKEYDAVASELTELNLKITPDKSDEELLKLIRERKDLEAELGALSQKLGVTVEVSEEIPQRTDEMLEREKALEKSAREAEVALPEKTLDEDEQPVEERQEEKQEEKVEPTAVPSQPEMKSNEEHFGKETIVADPLKDSGEFNRYLEQIEGSPHSLGMILQGLPVVAKRSKSFMLKVAAIDPAYAMHYADAETLKKDEDFNIRVAGIKNVRNTGNPLAEMLPEMRTAKVVLAGVKQDYRNIRFANAGMAGYDEMLSIAKKGALAKVKDLKEGADVMFLIPKPLQKDQAFMAEVEKLTKPKEETPSSETEAETPPQPPKTGSANKKGPWSIRHSGSGE